MGEDRVREQGGVETEATFVTCGAITRYFVGPKRGGFCAAGGEKSWAKKQMVEVFIPMQLKRRGGRKEVILPSGRENEGAVSQQNQPLVIAIARAYRWIELLETGRVGSIVELAKHNNVDPAYIRRFLNLTLLARRTSWNRSSTAGSPAECRFPNS